MTRQEVSERCAAFCQRFDLRLPILMAPMAGACPPGLAAAVARAGGMGGNGALLDDPAAIDRWMQAFDQAVAGESPRSRLQVNLWIPDPPPRRDAGAESDVRRFLGNYGPPVADDAFDPLAGPDFQSQCQALIAARPAVISSIMGLYPSSLVDQFRQAGIAWFACVTTVDEARKAQAAGADVIVAQGAEAGGHRGAFTAANGRDQSVGLMSLLPQVVDAVTVPVVATGGIADERQIAAALMLGASAVQIGSALLCTDESAIAPAWQQGLRDSAPEATRLTRAFSGRWGRSLATDYVLAANAPDAPEPAPYPVQRAFTGAMRKAAAADNDVNRMQTWAGQSAALARGGSAEHRVKQWWHETRALLAIDWSF